MTKEQIEARKAQLIQIRDETLSSFNAIVGAINDCDYWLAQLEAEALKAPEPQKGKVKDD
jgi:hypothetical protein